MSMACGIIEVYGLVAALVACDAGCKAADVTVETFDKNKPGNPGVILPFLGRLYCSKHSVRFDGLILEASNRLFLY
ncbi:MAG: BMC domain-containing protein, partial [Clostridia bacterium]|nr:BMC domain-containing protein [Clostridia bacterium]